jgi:hypothetical protein
VAETFVASQGIGSVTTFATMITMTVGYEEHEDHEVFIGFVSSSPSWLNPLWYSCPFVAKPLVVFAPSMLRTIVKPLL